MNTATELLAKQMELARSVNPRGDLYRKLPVARLLLMLEQNVEEVKLAIKYDNDVPDKLADVGNYCAFLLHNYLEGE